MNLIKASPKTTAGKLSAIALAAALMASTTAVNAQDIRFGFGFTSSFATYPAIERYAEKISADAGLNVEVFPGSLLTAPEMMAGIRDGLADAGWDALPYNPVEFSESNLIAEMSMQITAGEVPQVPGAAMVGAFLEYILFNCPDCWTQFKAQNIVFTAGTGTTPYYLICTKPVVSLADIKGLRIRTAAGNFERWAASVGASGVAMPGNETYDALAQGVLDCSSNDLTQLVGQRFMDIATSFTVGVPGGVYAGTAAANWNGDVWRGLTQEQRTAIIAASARFVADTIVLNFETSAAAVETATAAGVDQLEAAEDLKAATAAFVEGDKATIEQQYTNQYGLQNVAAKIDTASALIEKWRALTMNTPADIDVLEKLYWDEIYSKIDPATFGME